MRHEGLRRAFFRWLDRLPPPDGRHILRLDENRYVYLEVADTPLVATSLRWSGERALLGLTDGSEEALDPRTLTADDDGHAALLGARGAAAGAAGDVGGGDAGGADREWERGTVLRVGGREIGIGRG